MSGRSAGRQDQWLLLQQPGWLCSLWHLWFLRLWIQSAANLKHNFLYPTAALTTKHYRNCLTSLIRNAHSTETHMQQLH